MTITVLEAECHKKRKYKVERDKVRKYKDNKVELEINLEIVEDQEKKRNNKQSLVDRILHELAYLLYKRR